MNSDLTWEGNMGSYWRNRESIVLSKSSQKLKITGYVVPYIQSVQKKPNGDKQ